MPRPAGLVVDSQAADLAEFLAVDFQRGAAHDGAIQADDERSIKQVFQLVKSARQQLATGHEGFDEVG